MKNSKYKLFNELMLLFDWQPGLEREKPVQVLFNIVADGTECLGQLVTHGVG
jgi:hypothetical protein